MSSLCDMHINILLDTGLASILSDTIDHLFIALFSFLIHFLSWAEASTFVVAPCASFCFCCYTLGFSFSVPLCF